jgi:hypothetical protein
MEAIRAVRPTRLYVAADGPRDREGEAGLCEAARRVATAVDWPGEVRTLFRDQNLGCRAGVSSAIDWFFEHEPEGIILEDDCMPSASFFPYCADLLDRFRDDDRVMCITGDNFQKDMRGYRFSYYFSKYNHAWGWASWRRAWRNYDLDMALFPKFMRSGRLGQMSSTPGFSKSWEKRFKRAYRGEIDTWDYQWQFACWAHGGLTCTPRTNLVSNIGFRADATHTKDPANASANLAAGDLLFPLRHPEQVVVSEEFDAHVDAAHFGIRQPSDKVRLRTKIGKALRFAGFRAS